MYYLGYCVNISMEKLGIIRESLGRTGFRAEIWASDLQNAKQKKWPLYRDIR